MSPPIPATAFTSISGATATTYSFTTTAGQNGYEYEAVFTNAVGTATTTAATLTVTAPTTAPTITANPSSVILSSPVAADKVARGSGDDKSNSRGRR